ncbi:hypothetical protein GGI12_004851, partial [Dipsacomyces acuminosporus]
MSVSDSETDSDYRQFSPGRYAIRQLSRSVSRRTKQILAPAINRLSQRDTDRQQTNSSDGIFGENDDGKYRVAGGASGLTSNGYLAYEFSQNSAVPYKRGPPEPSAIHRRSVSFDNLVLLPGMLPRRVTEPPVSATTSPLEVGLPAAATWNSGTILTKAAAAASTVSVSHLERSYSSMRKQWLSGLGHPLNTALDSEYHRKSLSSPPNNPEFHRPLTIDTSLIDSPGSPQEARLTTTVTFTPNTAAYDESRQPSHQPSHRRYNHNRESFSGPAHLDMSTVQTDSSHSSIYSEGLFRNRNTRANAGDSLV